MINGGYYRGMIYLFHGSDEYRVGEKARVFLDILRKRKPEAPFFEFDEETISILILEELSNAQGLFESNNIVAVQNTLTLPEIEEYVKENTLVLAESGTVFVFKEEKVPTSLKKVLQRYSKKIWVFDEKEIKERKNTLVFELADSFSVRDKQKTWVLLQKALKSGLKPEQILSTLFWQVKNMFSLAQAEEEGEQAVTALSLNPFVERKARRFAKNFTEEELHCLSSSLVTLYHEARLGGEELEMGLERFMLKW